MLILKLMEFFVSHGWLYGLGSGGLFIALSVDESRKTLRAILFSAFVLSLMPVAAVILAPTWAENLDVPLEFFVVDLLFYPVAVAASWYGAWWILRHGVHKWERLAVGWKKASTLERNRRTDVREMGKFLPKAEENFDPLLYINEKKGIFVGLNEDRQPFYIDYEDWRISHVLLTGRTRAGKGVSAQTILWQAVQRKEFCIVLDPKSDAFMPHVYKAACDKSGQPWVFLDLRSGAHPQINMIEGCDEETIENMLIGAFSLSEKGDAADFYRLGDREAALQVARHVSSRVKAGQPCPTPAEVYAMFGEGWKDNAAGFSAAMREMAELQSVNRASGGVDIEALERSGGMLYVVGDMGNTRIVRMQRMLLIRLMMLAKKRDYITQDPRTITVFADEFKVHISKPFMTSLGASAGWGLHCILAFQSLQDLADCPADLDKDAVRGGVMENCALQLSYRIKDPETAEWLARSTGKILVDDESRKITKNLAQAETFDDERTVRLAERYFVDENMMLNMPKGCGVLSGASTLPAFCYTSPIKVQRDLIAVTPTILPPSAADVAVGDLALDEIPEI